MASNNTVIENQIQSISIQKISQVIINNFTELQEAAYKLIQTMESQAAIFETTKQKTKIIQQLNTATLYQQMKSNQDMTRIVTNAALQFQSAVNKFLEKNLNLIYMNITTGNIIVQTDLNMRKFFAYYMTAGQGRAKVDMSNKRQQILNGLEKQGQLLEELQKKLNTRSTTFKYILDQAIRRKENKDMNYKKENPELENTFYWWPSPRFPYIHISRRTKGNGFLAEAFIDSLFNESSYIGDIEKNLEILSGYLDKTDNKGAALGQDISQILNGKAFQFSVKSGKFNTPMIRQFIVQALVILGMDQNTTVQGLDKMLNDKDINFDEMANEYLNDYINNKAAEDVKEKILTEEGSFKITSSIF